MTTIKARRPLAEVTVAPVAAKTNKAQNAPEMTVEQYLEEQCSSIINDFKQHGAGAIEKFRAQHATGAELIQSLLQQSATSTQMKKIVVTLKCVGGPHLGQKFLLEPADGAAEDMFKVGRSSGRHFKEHGVSLYKDKEISTSHARIEIRNAQVFLVDSRSTNGTQLNNDDVPAQTPQILKQGDVITMGGSELEVFIQCNRDDKENLDDACFASV